MEDGRWEMENRKAWKDEREIANGESQMPDGGADWLMVDGWELIGGSEPRPCEADSK